MLKLWPNWFWVLARAPNQGITHSCRWSVPHLREGLCHPERPGWGTPRVRGWLQHPGHAACAHPLVFLGREEPLASLLRLPINMHDLLIKSYSRLGACKKLTSKPWKGGNGKCWREMSH